MSKLYKKVADITDNVASSTKVLDELLHQTVKTLQAIQAWYNLPKGKKRPDAEELEVMLAKEYNIFKQLRNHMNDLKESVLDQYKPTSKKEQEMAKELHEWYVTNQESINRFTKEHLDMLNMLLKWEEEHKAELEQQKKKEEEENHPVNKVVNGIRKFVFGGCKCGRCNKLIL